MVLQVADPVANQRREETLQRPDLPAGPQVMLDRLVRQAQYLELIVPLQHRQPLLVVQRSPQGRAPLQIFSS